MKALVLAGGFPQIYLINELHRRNIKTVLVDYLQHPIAQRYSDYFFRVSTLDVAAVRQLAIDEKVDFVITVCTDQAMMTMAIVSEELGLPCYLSADLARSVTNKAHMKRVFAEKEIPSSPFVISKQFEDVNCSTLRFPLVVKPVDCNSSKGVQRIDRINELPEAYDKARKLSRTGEVIIEEYVEGQELSIDLYVENGQAIVLDITTSEKLSYRDKFIICRTWHPAIISDVVKKKIYTVAQQIVDAFDIMNSPLLIQALVKGENIWIIEFSTRTGGGVKHLSVKERSGIDIVSVTVDLALGNRPHIELKAPKSKYMVDEYLYCRPGTLDHIEGFELLKQQEVISDYYLFKPVGTIFSEIENSGDRVGGFTIEGNTKEEILKRHMQVLKNIRVLSTEDQDLLIRVKLNGAI